MSESGSLSATNRSWPLARYCLGRTFRHRVGSYVGVVLLIGVTGGLAMGSLAAARRTQSSFSTYIASTHPSTLTFSVFNPATGEGTASIASKIEALPDVSRVRTLSSETAVLLTARGAPRLATANSVVILGSTDGYTSKMDRVSVVKGTRPNPTKTNQIGITEGAARIWGVRLGQIVPIGFYSANQQNEPGFGTPRVRPRLTLHARVVAIEDTNSQVVQDQVDGEYGFVFISPRLVTRVNRLTHAQSAPALYGIQLRHGNAGIVKVEGELVKLVPPHGTYNFHLTSRVTTTAELAIKPESVALGAFGAIAALVCLLLAAQSVSRLMRRSQEERRVMRAFGARPRELLAENFLGVGASVLTGVALAVLVALALSPLAPLGPVRAVYPDRGVNADWTVLLGGAGVLVVSLFGYALASAVLNSAHRVSQRGDQRTSSLTARRLRSLPLPTAVSLGVHFALESRRERDDVAVRSVLFGSVLAVALMVTTLTFASGLSTLVSRPALYGWNWNYALNPTSAVPPQALEMLRHDPDVAAWSGASYTDVTIDGQSIPVLIEQRGAPVQPPVLSGHGLRANSDIVLGSQTLAVLHKRVGQQVTVSYESPADAPIYIAPTKLTIVGTATFPAVGYASSVSEHTSMGVGALLPWAVQPPAFLKAISSTDPNLDGPELVFVRLRARVSARAGRANLERIVRASNAIFAKDPHAAGNTVGLLSVQQPAQIVDYRTIGTTPMILAGGLALGAVAALALTLLASVRRRRRDLAVLKSLGLARRSVRAAIAFQSVVDALVGVVVGIPLGILAGRWLWSLFARDIDAVPYATVPVTAIVLVGAGTLGVALLVSLWPGRRAALTPPGLVLRAE